MLTPIKTWNPAFAIGSIALVAATACNRGPSEAELAAQAEAKELRTELLSRDSLIADMSRSFGDIEDNLKLMRSTQQIVVSASSEDKLTTSQRDRILNDLQMMNGLMQESRDQVAELTKKLDRSRVESGSLRKKLNDLDAELALRDSAIMELKDNLLARDFRIEEINMQLSDLGLEMAKRAATIEQLGNELHTAYYAIGTRKELAENGVLQRRGGVLGVGKTSELNAAASNDKFNRVDTRTLERIPLGGEKKKIHFVSEHPTGSFEVVEEGDKLAYIRIKDADSFWRLSHYLVAEVQ
ncbi:MAG TPA: hypothetical protein PKY96_01895 [Flavobacteriales bacterium]|nr:hypothetical protein [Flavobacteriales bacterium]